MENQHLEATLVWMSQQRSHFFNFSCDDERLENVWLKHENRNKEARVPRILGIRGVLLKFNNAVLKKHLNTSEMHKIALNNNNLKRA